MKVSIVFIVCMFLVAFSWAICPLLSNTFEPFDSGLGFIVGQSVMLIFMAYIGWSTSFKHIFVGLVGLYLSQNIYAYTFGGSEQRAWALLLLITSLALCLIPLASGLLTRVVKIGFSKYSKNS